MLNAFHEICFTLFQHLVKEIHTNRHPVSKMKLQFQWMYKEFYW